MELDGKVAHVTGAGAGIGRAIALRLAREGARVVVSDVDERAGRETVARIDVAGGRAAFVSADVAIEGDVRTMIAFTEEAFGGLDVLVNNAGGAPEPHFPQAAPAHWLRQVAVNLLGVMLATHYGIAALRRRGGGAIVNVSSRAGEGFRPYDAPEYAAAKAGVWRFSAALGSLAGEGIRVNCVCPDWVATEATRRASDAPPRLVPAEELADVVLLLAGDETLAGRVVLCPHDGPWGVVSLDEPFRVEPLRGLPTRA